MIEAIRVRREGAVRQTVERIGLQTSSEDVAMLPPEDVISDCVRVFPAFRQYWDAEDNLFREDDGSYTVCGVYIGLSWFIRENWKSFHASHWRAFAQFVSDHEKKVEGPAAAVGACLLENLEGEKFSHLVAQYFDRELLQRYQFSG